VTKCPKGYNLFQRNIDTFSQFVKDYCLATRREVIYMLEHSIEVINKIENGAINQVRQNDIVSIIWLMFVKVASYQELYLSGTMRIDDNDNLIFKFLKQGFCYER
jgi:hypothetical protein